MDPRILWEKFSEGTCGAATGLLLAAAALAVSLVLTSFVLMHLVRWVSSRDVPKVRDSRVRRVRTALTLTAFSFATYVFFHAVMPRETRQGKLPYALSEMAVTLFSGYSLFEILLAFLADFLPQARGRPAASPLFKDILRGFVLLGLFLVGAKIAFPGADIGALLTTSAILSIVLGLALQESLSNIFAGLMLSVDRPYKAGDWIEVDGKEGKVLDSNWRSTRILTRDDDVIHVPNSVMAKGNILNFSVPTPTHLCRRSVSVEYEAPPNKVRSVLVKLMSGVEGILKDPAPDVFVTDYGDSGIVYQMRFWIEDYARRSRIEAEVMRGIWYHLRREGISMPYPVRDVYIRREKPARKPEELLTQLRKVDILAPLKEEELLMLAGDLSSHLFGKGEVVCRQGDPGSTFYIMRTGTVAVRVRGDDGVEAEVARLGPGTYFGEMSLLTGEPRSSTCQTLEDCELLCLDRESFSVLLQENPPVAQAMSDILAARQQASQEKLTQERETMVRRRSQDQEARSHTILEKIRSIFGFSK